MKISPDFMEISCFSKETGKCSYFQATQPAQITEPSKLHLTLSCISEKVEQRGRVTQRVNISMNTNTMIFSVKYCNCFLFIVDVKEAMIHKNINYFILR